MDKEPNELVGARASLKTSEENLGDPERLSYLKQGISLLNDVITGEYAQVYKDRANNMIVTYRNRILLEVKGVLSNADSYSLDSLDYWNNTMAVFTDGGSDDDQEFKACKEQLFSKWARRFLGSLKPWELEMIKSEFQKKTTPKGE